MTNAASSYMTMPASYPSSSGRQGISFDQVAAAAEAIVREGLRLTLRGIRAQTGGSLGTVQKHFDIWKQKHAPHIETTLSLPPEIQRVIIQVTPQHHPDVVLSVTPGSHSQKGAQTEGSGAGLAPGQVVDNGMLEVDQKACASVTSIFDSSRSGSDGKTPALCSDPDAGNTLPIFRALRSARRFRNR